jgi:hypothetical protein
MDYWPAYYQPALHWLTQVQTAIDRHAGDQAGALTAIINALEYQLEVGAHVPTLTSLLAALRGLAQAYGLSLNALHLDADPQTLVQRIQPPSHPTR